MKVVQINGVCGSGSTGKICLAISQLLTERNIENYILYTSGNSDYPLAIKCAGDRYLKIQALKARILGNWGFNSASATKKMIAELDRIQPNVVYLHNLHGHSCNIEMLFDHFRKKKTKVFWTFHDCWAFTGYCMYFTMAKCDKWQTGCGDCPLKKESSWFFDRSRQMLERKKKMIEGIDLTVITPSHWLADLVRQSFYSDCPIKVIHNGIDLQVFKPTANDFRKKYGLEDKYIVLGVAFGWGARKGLDVFLKLASSLDERYRIVLVGTNDAVDKLLPSNIISIHRTSNPKELAEIYTEADVFANPTREEVLGLVNLESLACGTPVVTFRTGGSPECVDESCGTVVDCDDMKALEDAIMYICEQTPYSQNVCIQHSEFFNQKHKFAEYIQLLETESL